MKRDDKSIRIKKNLQLDSSLISNLCPDSFYFFFLGLNYILSYLPLLISSLHFGGEREMKRSINTIYIEKSRRRTIMIIKYYTSALRKRIISPNTVRCNSLKFNVTFTTNARAERAFVHRPHRLSNDPALNIRRSKRRQLGDIRAK